MMGLPEAQLDKAIQVAKDGNDLLLEARQRIAELEAENMRVGLHNCWLEEQVEYGGDVIGMREAVITKLKAKNARLREERLTWVKWAAGLGMKVLYYVDLPYGLEYDTIDQHVKELEE